MRVARVRDCSGMDQREGEGFATEANQGAEVFDRERLGAIWSVRDLSWLCHLVVS